MIDLFFKVAGYVIAGAILLALFTSLAKVILGLLAVAFASPESILGFLMVIGFFSYIKREKIKGFKKKIFN